MMVQTMRKLIKGSAKAIFFRFFSFCPQITQYENCTGITRSRSVRPSRCIKLDFHISFLNSTCLFYQKASPTLVLVIDLLVSLIYSFCFVVDEKFATFFFSSLHRPLAMYFFFWYSKNVNTGTLHGFFAKG